MIGPMEIIADLHIHSKYSRACSKELTPANLALWADRKGIDVLGTGDFTHPAWNKELKEALVEDQPGLFKLKNGNHRSRFMLTTEISCIYKRGGKTRRVHNCVFAPSFSAVDRIIAELEKRGCNLRSDGRPIIGLDSEELLKICLEASPDCLLVPAHAWTPWFAIFGSMSGFDTLEECFGENAKLVPAIETGLSSDPLMNWQLSKLDDTLLISNSDAHSLANLGREANVFDIAPEKLSYGEIVRILREKDRAKFLYTIEFHPEEGMYHFDGHRVCGVRWHPDETKKHKGLCSKCGKPVTVGVYSRVNALADRPEGARPQGMVPYKSIVPLAEIIAEALGQGKATKGVLKIYEAMIGQMPEFKILIHAAYDELAAFAPAEVVEGIRRMREGKVTVEPGFDGQYGTVKIFSAADRKRFEQSKLF
jgi:DNA helicase II / ATP-dependent DNA helicase PcrA